MVGIDPSTHVPTFLQVDLLLVGGAVGGYCVHSQYLLGLGLLGKGEELVVQCWSWLDGELAIGNILLGPFFGYVNVTKEALWNREGPSWCSKAIAGKLD